ncbi:hypothetical protein D3C84_908230 [compost metagenome]
MVIQPEERAFGNSHHIVGCVGLKETHIDNWNGGFMQAFVFTVDERTSHSVFRSVWQPRMREGIPYDCLSLDDTHALGSPRCRRL